MGHDSHAGMSPAHRRNQNPVSPSSSLFRRSSTFPRDEPDLSWMALLRRHRFLLLALVLLAFLCTVYLYFAIKLGADTCSGLSAKDEALCRLKKTITKTSHGHRATRRLLDVHSKFWSDKCGQEPNDNAVCLIDVLSQDKSIQSVLILGCMGSYLSPYLLNRFPVSLPGVGCEEKPLLNERSSDLSPDFSKTRLLDSSLSFDLIICKNCNVLDSTMGESKFLKMQKLLRHGGLFLWISEALASPGSTGVSSAHLTVQLRGWTCLSRIDGMVLWQKT